MQKQKGFTLLEILLVIALIAILAGIIIVAINPAKQTAEARNAQRRSDVNAILSAVYQYSLDNSGSFLNVDDVPGTSQVIGTAGAGCSGICGSVTTTVSCVDLSSLAPSYLVTIPFDPQDASGSITKYYINKDVGNRITVGACEPENGATISISK